MPSVLRLSPESVARSRFALSPLAETVATAINLARPAAPWLDPNAPERTDFQRFLAADPFAAGLVALVSSTKWLPAPIVIPPTGGMTTTLPDELVRVRMFDDAAVIDELHRSRDLSWQHHDLDWITGRRLGDRIAELLQAIWNRFTEPDWPRTRAILERDVTFRGGLLAAYGWTVAIDKMTRHSRWVAADAIQFSTWHDAPDKIVGDNGLQFVPVTARGTWVAEWPPTDPHDFALVYPAFGVAEPGPQSDPGALDALLGAGRARILRELDHPAGTSELVVVLGASLGTVGGHLAVLRRSGLVVGTRIGHRVVYRRTELGDRLANPPGATPEPDARDGPD